MEEQPNNVSNVSVFKHEHTNDLEDKRWKLKRKGVVIRANRKCAYCAFEGILDVHHLYYIKGKHLWEYPQRALVALCRGCHTKWHEEHNLEYREEIWSENKDYQAPNKQKVYFVTKGKKSVKKKVPYVKVKDKFKKSYIPPLSPIEKAKAKLRNKVKKGKARPSFSPIPEWRKQKKAQV